MFFGHNALITGLDCHHVSHQSKGSTFVNGRPFYSLSYRLSGQTVLEYGGKTLVSEPGTLTYVPMNFSYFTQTKAGEMIVIHFDLTDEEAPGEPAVITPARGTDYAQRFLALRRQLLYGTRRDLQCLSVFYGILADLEQEESQLSPVTPRMLAAKEYLDTHLGSSELGVSTVAQSLGISDSYFRRAFRDAFGMAPSTYIKQKRMETAKTLLFSGYYTVTETAMLCGFENLSYFSSEFRKTYGCSPRAFLNKK